MRIVINAMGKEKRVAFLEDKALVGLDIIRPTTEPQVSDIYLGTVTKINKKINAAFVNIGYKENAFIHLQDIPDSYRLHEGLKLMVQVKREGSATKAPLLTAMIEVSCGSVVYSYGKPFLAISKKIKEVDKVRLQQLVAPLLQDNEGIILRSAAVDVSPDKIKEDLVQARREMEELMTRAKGANRKIQEAMVSIPTMLRSNPLVDEQTEIICDDATLYSSLKTQFSNVSLFREKGGIFSAYNLEVAINRLLRPTVFLKNGASIVIEKTEAMWVIDVNSGNYKSKKEVDEVAFDVNLAVIEEIGRQMKLRNMSGFILVDFIGGMSRAQLDSLQEQMQEVASLDTTTVRVEGLSENGLMQLTRRKRQKSLLEEMQCMCPTCEGSGYVSSVQTLIYQMERELRGVFASDPSYVAVTVTMDVMDAFLDEISFDGDIDWMIADEVRPFYRISQVEH
ncbi:ribonuclease E/G [Listeria newyorkensis]|uniref:S1 RNA-binding domain-containing protein n=1 Tax=Listeria newyorkensis TaxID=1497681 RepID=A0A841YU66_9LIST|nr:ribonuclease E/G [Listeria newyorkensis]MBC1456619.1 S1 RNA-binding domain-containing protein [Listeria newyorkensis]